MVSLCALGVSVVKGLALDLRNPGWKKFPFPWFCFHFSVFDDDLPTLHSQNRFSQTLPSLVDGIVNTRMLALRLNPHRLASDRKGRDLRLTPISKLPFLG